MYQPQYTINNRLVHHVNREALSPEEGEEAEGGAGFAVGIKEVLCQGEERSSGEKEEDPGQEGEVVG